MVQLPQGSHGEPMLMCPTPKCPTVGSRRDVTEAFLLDIMRNWLESYRVASEPKPIVPVGEDPAQSIRTAERTLNRLKKALDDLTQQKGRLFDLLEQGVYSNDVFLERSRVLSGRIGDAEKQVASARERLSSLRRAELERKSVIPRVQNVLDIYDTIGSPAEKNALLKSVLERVVYTKTTGGRYQESDLNLFLYPKIPNPDEL